MRKKMTATELMAKLNTDKNHQENINKKAEQRKIFEEFLRQDEKPLLALLKENGIVIDSVWELVNSNRTYKNVIKLLVDNLEKNYHPRIKAGIARALAIPEAKHIGFDVLLKEYKNTPPDENVEDANKKGYKEGLAVALSSLLGKAELDIVLKLIQDKNHKSSRIFFVDAIAQYKNDEKVKDVIEKLRDDSDLKKIIQDRF
jgi:tRNA(Ile)-lysidine synthase TilS/MesJ